MDGRNIISGIKTTFFFFQMSGAIFLAKRKADSWNSLKVTCLLGILKQQIVDLCDIEPKTFQ